jgi:membrane protein DedA with SNARE-associated domain
MERELVGWLLRFGAPLLFFAQAFGIFGVPIPDELLLTIAGALIAKHLLHAPATISAAIAGCLVGITASFFLGRGVEHALEHYHFLRHGGAFDRAQDWFRRFGGWLLAFGYFIPGVRHVTAIVAGSSGLSYRKFAMYAYSGGLLWCLTFLSLGYYAGDRWPLVLHAIRSHLILAAILLAAAACLFVLLRFRKDVAESSPTSR